MERSSDTPAAPIMPAMALTPHEALLQKEEIEERARFYAVLADPTRLTIIRLLLTGSMVVGDLVKGTGAPNATISYHLRVLAEAHLVTVEQRGRTRTVHLTSDGIATAGIGYMVGIMLDPSGRTP